MTAVTPTKHLYIPADKLRHGCPRELSPFCETATPIEGELNDLKQQITSMRLIHKTKENVFKKCLNLGLVHKDLRLNALTLFNSGSSNVILCKVSFDCLITQSSGDIRDYITFDLKIPLEIKKNKEEIVFSFDFLEKLYGGKENLHTAMEYYYTLGRKISNPHNEKHGHEVDCDPRAPYQAATTRHTEQFLVAYLALPNAADMLLNRLRAEIRGTYPESTSVKVYNMGLHMHSTKTCCGACEYSMIGLMNDRIGWLQQRDNLIKLGFISNFTESCNTPNVYLPITLPKKSRFRLLVTVTANERDADHQAVRRFEIKDLKANEPVPSYDIFVKDLLVSHHIFTTLFTTGYDKRAVPTDSNLADKTVFISGSKDTEGSPGTILRTKTVRKNEDSNLRFLSNLHLG